MSFFNKKEDVMDIQLTTYGKELLSKGRFKPVYYAFFDEGVLYDGARAGITEIQNAIQVRIKDQTPFLKAQADFLSPSVIASRGELVPNEMDAREFPMFDFDITYESQLGTSKNNSDSAPAWKVSTLESSLTGSVTFLTASSTSRTLPIPQLNLGTDSTKYQTYITLGGVEASDECDISSLLSSTSNEFPDGTVLNVEEGGILLKIEEANTLNLKDNFEVELFQVIQKNENQVTTTPTKVLKPLKFFTFKSQIKNGIMMDQAMDFNDIQNLDKIDESFASNYFEILFDGGVDENAVCTLDLKRSGQDPFVKDPVQCVSPLDKKIKAYSPVDSGDVENILAQIEEECE